MLPRGICVPAPRRAPVAIDLTIKVHDHGHAPGFTATAVLRARLDATNRASAAWPAPLQTWVAALRGDGPAWPGLWHGMAGKVGLERGVQVALAPLRTPAAAVRPLRSRNRSGGCTAAATSRPVFTRARTTRDSITVIELRPLQALLALAVCSVRKHQFEDVTFRNLYAARSQCDSRSLAVVFGLTPAATHR